MSTTIQAVRNLAGGRFEALPERVAAAFPAWAATPVMKRAQVLFAYESGIG
jgi:acyl-CoA reductase-like NAD-dependent aldehyde dehydrogenase